jgi:cellulose synthase/poly-beta-1,6-N-acetylglucosamine synthase-like glycosyltransferase
VKLSSLMASWVLWISFGVIAYSYFVYPLLLFALYGLAQIRRDLYYLLKRSERRVGSQKGESLPGVTLIIPAHNEEGHLPDKIENLRKMRYPKEKLQVVFVSDGSTDRTNEILSSLHGQTEEIVILPRRLGKPSALNEAITRARHDLLVFSDASTLFAPDAVEKLIRHFVDPSVGGVCGALKFCSSQESQQTEGLYWKFENVVRLMEARLGATLTASGAIYALRREAYRPLDSTTVLDDFVIPMNARNAGFRILYDPEATATEVAPSSIGGEFARRVRLASGSFHSLGDFMRIRLDAITRFAFTSHKLCRWIVPFFLITLLVSDCFLSSPFYRLLLIGQALFYLWAGAGFVFQRRMQNIRYGRLGYFIFAMNVAFLVGFFRFLTGRTDVIWQRVNS